MTPAIVTITLNPALDKFSVLPRWRQGQDVRSQAEWVSAGGKGINVVRTLKQLKVSALAVGIAGGKSGEWLREELRREEIGARCVEVSGATRINESLVDVSLGQVTRVLGHGPRLSSRESQRVLKELVRITRGRSWVAFCGSLPEGFSETLLRQLIKKAKQSAKIILDLSGSALTAAIKEKPFCVKPNREEAERWLGYSLSTSSRLKKAIESFWRQGVTIPVISLGKAGFVAGFAGEVYQVTRPSIPKRLHEVGCGDGLVAGLLAGWSRHLSLAQTLTLAMAAASANGYEWVPGKLNYKVFDRVVRNVTIKRI